MHQLNQTITQGEVTTPVLCVCPPAGALRQSGAGRKGDHQRHRVLYRDAGRDGAQI